MPKAAQMASPREHLHKSKPVSASAAKQSMLACPSCTDGSPRRCAPRDDELMQTFPSRTSETGPLLERALDLANRQIHAQGRIGKRHKTIAVIKRLGSGILSIYDQGIGGH